MPLLFLMTRPRVMGLSDHVTMTPAVSRGVIMLDLDMAGEFFQGCHGSWEDDRQEGQ